MPRSEPSSYGGGVEPRFVDIHSHVVPSGDDGVQTVSEGLALARDAFEHGTRVLYATPHVSPVLPLNEERERRIRRVFAELREQAPLELRLGFELTPMSSFLDEDPWRYVLEETEHVLVEIPFVGRPDLFLEVGEWIERAGLTPVVAHPERTEAVLRNAGLADELAQRGWPLQVNASSLLGRHSPEMERESWRLVDERLAALVASDGHRAARPMLLDEAYELTRTRVGEGRASRLFDGSALGLAERLQVGAVPAGDCP
jgi:protein-tyrosine phosphatase